LKTLFALAVLLFSSFGIAEESQCQQNDENCIGIGQWQFSVAVGAGVLTNPLSGGDDYPLLVVPYVSYYHDKFFLENTTVGYTFSESRNFDISFIVEPNTEQAFFERFHIRNLIAPEEFGVADGTITKEGDSNTPVSTGSLISVDDIAKRKWALDSGLLGHWYLNQNSQFALQWLNDISGTYQGSHINLAYQYKMKPLAGLPLRVQLTAGIHWKDNRLVNYYYGLSERDVIDESLFYTGESTFNLFFGTTLNYKLTDDWTLRVSAKRQFLGSGIKNSPLVEKSHVTYFFVGGVYAF
jgi:outer membrane protein